MNNNIKHREKLTFNLSTIVLVLIIFSPCLLPANLCSIILVLIGISLFFLSQCKIRIKLIYYLLPLIIIFFIGMIGIRGHEFHHVFRDIIYALTPISLIYCGFWIADQKIGWSQIIKTLIIAGVTVSLIHLSKYLLNPGLLKNGIYDIRANAINPNINVIVLSLVFGAFQNRLHIENLFPKIFPRYFVLTLLFLSFLLSFSRTGLITLIILTISILGLIGKINFRTIITIIILVGGFTAIILTTPTDDVETFRGKIARSTKEIAISDYTDLSDINNNWRGFETFKTLIAFGSGSFFEKCLGQGFGALVDLGFTMNLSGIDFSEIPIMHNGYAYVLFKTGLFGIFCYLIFYSGLLKFSLKHVTDSNQKKILCSRLLFGFTLCLMLSMFVVGGMAEIHDSEYVFLVGYTIRQIEIL